MENTLGRKDIQTELVQKIAKQIEEKYPEISKEKVPALAGEVYTILTDALEHTYDSIEDCNVATLARAGFYKKQLGEAVDARAKGLECAIGVFEENNITGWYDLYDKNSARAVTGESRPVSKKRSPIRKFLSRFKFSNFKGMFQRESESKYKGMDGLA